MTNRKRITNAVEACGWKIKNLDFERESPDVGSWCISTYAFEPPFRLYLGLTLAVGKPDRRQYLVNVKVCKDCMQRLKMLSYLSANSIKKRLRHQLAKIPLFS